MNIMSRINTKKMIIGEIECINRSIDFWTHVINTDCPTAYNRGYDDATILQLRTQRYRWHALYEQLG